MMEAGKAGERSPAMIAIAEPSTESAATTRDFRYEYVRVADLKIDPSYHPEERFQERHARSLGSFDESKVGVITCSQRSGVMWLLDGNHRRWLAMQAGVEYLYAKVFFGKSQMQEAIIFHALSKQLPLLGLDLWQTRRVEQDPMVLQIETILSRHGVRVVRTQAHRSSDTKSVATLERIYAADPALLDRVIGLVRRVWPDERRALDSLPLQAVAAFIHAYSRTIPQFNPKGLEERLRMVSPEAIYKAERDQRAAELGKFGTGRSGPTGASSLGQYGYARRAMLAIYNRSRRNRLPDLTLSDFRAMREGRIADLSDRM